MRLLADYHHHDLWESLELLCARLGWTLLRPMGMDWFEQGYWNFERHVHGDAVAKQYLQPWHDDHSGLRYDASHDRWTNLITLEEARAYPPDIVMASVAHNHEGFHRFAQEIGAKFGIHLGNVRFSLIDMKEDRWDLADFGLITTDAGDDHCRRRIRQSRNKRLADRRSSTKSSASPTSATSRHPTTTAWSWRRS